MSKAFFGSVLALSLLSALSAHAGVTVVSCNSEDRRTEYCYVDGNITHAVLTKQKSNAPCDSGSWGYSDNYLWVDAGCRGDFLVTYDGDGRGQGGGRGRHRESTMQEVFLHSSGSSYYCPSSYEGLSFWYADVRSNGCYVPNTSADCGVTCHYRD